MTYPTFRPGLSFGIPTRVSHKNSRFRFYEKIYVIYDILKDQTVQYFIIDPFHQMSDFIEPKIDKAILLVDSINIYQMDSEVFKTMLTKQNALPL